MKLSAFIFLLFFLPVWVYSQSEPSNAVPDTILFNNGKTLVTHVVDTIGADITVINPHSRKHKKEEISKEAVFSIRFGYAGGKEDIFYIYDTLVGNDFTLDDARKFIAGEQDAERGFHGIGISIAAFAVGFASGFVIGDIFAFAPPFAFDAIMTYPVIRVRHRSVSDMKIANTDPYLYGYYIVASRKRMLRSFLWSGIGLAGGLITNNIINNNP